MSDVIVFTYSYKDKDLIENIFPEVFDNCYTSIDAAIKAYGIIKIINLIFENNDVDYRNVYNVPVCEDVHVYILRFLRQQIEALNYKLSFEKNAGTRTVYSNHMSLIKDIRSKLISKEPSY